MKEKGLKAATFSRALGFSPTYVRDLLEKNYDPRLTNAVAIAEALDVTLEWLVYGKDGDPVSEGDLVEAFDSHARSNPGEPIAGSEIVVGKEAYTPIPVYDLRASAGAGALATDQASDTFQIFRQNYLGALTPARTEDLAVITVSGDSMEPTLRHGDQILVDRSQKSVTDDGVYVLLLGEALMVKRCQRDFSNGSILIKSDNPLYDTITIGAGQQLEVKGRVVWFSRAIS